MFGFSSAGTSIWHAEIWVRTVFLGYWSEKHSAGKLDQDELRTDSTIVRGSRRRRRRHHHNPYCLASVDRASRFSDILRRGFQRRWLVSEVCEVSAGYSTITDNGLRPSPSSLSVLYDPDERDDRPSCPSISLRHVLTVFWHFPCTLSFSLELTKQDDWFWGLRRTTNVTS